MSEATKYAAGQWKQANAPKMLLNWVEKYHEWMRQGKKQPVANQAAEPLKENKDM